MAVIQTGITEIQLHSRQSSLGTTDLLQITTQGHKDALTIKVLAQITTMFLPASLIAVSISLINAVDRQLMYK